MALSINASRTRQIRQIVWKCFYKGTSNAGGRKRDRGMHKEKPDGNYQMFERRRDARPLTTLLYR
jgi:hypothetical protein